ncbi:FAD-dependent oxidoreductase [Alkalinema sp. FACHB-956]|uniref:FAD-dependent oxidoreductase n=1 Tax=Alkalinema sp. FACHB-956 TaxID=2692768 RepID=UPI001685DBC3|nr:FAD-dependent oxidoreductase [Alkalinema sp. FACHB-956]MBD2329534.1 FAD-dependent oxidoreductase [Alkalinema sp. FACHB-956]
MPQPQRLVLIGGGHSHAIALRLWGMQPLPHVQVTLISDVTEAPYSGMLPGHLAGFYRHQDCHIDLRSLATFANATLILDSAIGIDSNQQKVICQNHDPIAFDILSIDIGSTPQIPHEPNSFIIPAKPVPQFLTWWKQLCDRIQQTSHPTITLSIIGGGVGGVELALNLQARLAQLMDPTQIQIHLFHRSPDLLPQQAPWVQHYLQQQLQARQIQLYLNETVTAAIAPTVHCASGLTVTCDASLWVTQATAPAWLRTTGLALDDRGFIAVNAALQSPSHPHIFAAGDIATLIDRPCPKAGVFAVRQGPPLFQNLRHALQGQPLQAYHPQRRYLSLIGTGDRSAVATWGRWGWASPLCWWWKDWIDRRFMRQFQTLKNPLSAEIPTPSERP